MDSALFDGKLFTVEEARKSLPLVRAIVGDIVNQARDLRERHERLQGFSQSHGKPAQESDPYREEVEQIEKELQQDEEKLQEYVRELNELGVELKDPQRGLIDFPHLMDGRVVYLCWHLGEEELAYWHEVDAGFAGRQSLLENSLSGDDPLNNQNLNET